MPNCHAKTPTMAAVPTSQYEPRPNSVKHFLWSTTIFGGYSPRGWKARLKIVGKRKRESGGDSNDNDSPRSNKKKKKKLSIDQGWKHHSSLSHIQRQKLPLSWKILVCWAADSQRAREGASKQTIQNSRETFVSAHIYVIRFEPNLINNLIQLNDHVAKI